MACYPFAWDAHESPKLLAPAERSEESLKKHSETKDGPGKGKSHHLRIIKKATHLLQIMCFLNLRCGHMLRVQLILDKCADSQRCYGSPVITVPIIVISSIARSIKNSLALWNSTFPRMAPKASMPRLFVHSLLQNESVRLSSRPVSFLPWHYLFEKIRKDPYAGIIRTLPILVVGSNFCCCWLSEILAVEIPQSWLSDSPTSRSLFKLWASSVARKRLPRWPWQARNQVHRTIPKWMVYNGKAMKIWMIWG